MVRLRIIRITTNVSTGCVDQICELYQNVPISLSSSGFTKLCLDFYTAHPSFPSVTVFPHGTVQYACRPQGRTPNLPMSLAAKSPSRDLLKWNIWFHFEVLKLLNHLARKDAVRVVKLLCLAAGSSSADREHKG